MEPTDSELTKEELLAVLRQQRCLVQGLQKQVAKLLNELASRKPKKPKKLAKRTSPKKRKETAPPAEPPPSPPPRSKPSIPQKAKDIPKKGPLPAEIPRSTTRSSLTGSAACCASPKLVQGPDLVIEQRDFVPATAQVRRHEIEQWICQCCATKHSAPLPAIAVPKGSMTGRFLARIATRKCRFHLPLVRIGQEFKTLGFALASSTMSDAMGLVSDLLTPIYDRITARLFSTDLISLDGTGFKTLHYKAPGSHRGQFMVYCNDEVSVFDYSPTKAATHIAQFLGVGSAQEYAGLVVADSASNMGCLDKAPRIRCGCWQHARQKFKDARKSSAKEAEEGVAWIGALFDIDREAREKYSKSSEITRYRWKKSKLLLRLFWKWLNAVRLKFEADEDISKAIRYCLNQEVVLRRFLLDERIPLTNNRAETELGLIGRGRRGFLFLGNDSSGYRLAKIYTVVRTCIRMGIAPFDYLAKVLPLLSDLPINRKKGHLKTLTPWAYAEQGLSFSH